MADIGGRHDHMHKGRDRISEANSEYTITEEDMVYQTPTRAYNGCAGLEIREHCYDVQ